jgi:hypothetical protein
LRLIKLILLVLRQESDRLIFVSIVRASVYLLPLLS